jgi:hypothetical protein
VLLLLLLCPPRCPWSRRPQTCSWCPALYPCGSRRGGGWGEAAYPHPLAHHPVGPGLCALLWRQSGRNSRCDLPAALLLPLYRRIYTGHCLLYRDVYCAMYCLMYCLLFCDVYCVVCCDMDHGLHCGVYSDVDDVAAACIRGNSSLRNPLLEERLGCIQCQCVHMYTSLPYQGTLVSLMPIRPSAAVLTHLSTCCSSYHTRLRPY